MPIGRITLFVDSQRRKKRTAVVVNMETPRKNLPSPLVCGKKIGTAVHLTFVPPGHVVNVGEYISEISPLEHLQQQSRPTPTCSSDAERPGKSCQHRRVGGWRRTGNRHLGSDQLVETPRWHEEELQPRDQAPQRPRVQGNVTAVVIPRLTRHKWVVRTVSTEPSTNTVRGMCTHFPLGFYSLPARDTPAGALQHGKIPEGLSLDDASSQIRGC